MALQKDPVKRKAEDSQINLAKRVKSGPGAAAPSAAEDALDDGTMKGHWQKNSLSKLKVAELRDWAQAKKLPASGKKKAELVELVEGWFEGR